MALKNRKLSKLGTIDTFFWGNLRIFTHRDPLVEKIRMGQGPWWGCNIPPCICLTNRPCANGVAKYDAPTLPIDSELVPPYRLYLYGA